MSEFLNFLDKLERIEKLEIPRVLPDRSNPLEYFSNNEIHQRFRFEKKVIVEILIPLVCPQLTTQDRRGSPIPPALQLLVALRFYATGTFQITMADLGEMSQPSVSRIVKNVSHILARQLGQYVKFPNDLEDVKRKFYNIARFPGVIGCIDGTHVYIQCPSRTDGERYRNRKGRFSLNVQVVGGPDLEIFDIVCRWPGRVHDARIFNNSSVKLKLDQKILRGILLGDSGYPQAEYLFTPFLAPNSGKQMRYNRAQISTRNSVERLFGVWKRRFPCLQSHLSTRLDTTIAIIIATAVLHNIAIKIRDPLTVLSGDNGDIEQPSGVIIQENPHGNNTMRMLKNNFVNRYF